MRKTFVEIIEKQSEDSQFLTPETQEGLVKILQQVREATLREAAEKVQESLIIGLGVTNPERILNLDKNSIKL